MKTYDLPGGVDALFRPSTGDRIIGSKEDGRSTKTFFSSERGALLLSLVGNHARGLIKRVMLLHQLKTGVLLTEEQVKEKYPGCKKWSEVHQMILEHYASVEGFAVQATVSLEKTRLHDQQSKPDSSIQESKGDPPRYGPGD